jgi:hypothetical protein
MPEQWHYSKGNEKLGPVSRNELRTMAADGRLTPNDLVWRDGMSTWKPAGRINGLFPTAAAPPPLPSLRQTPVGAGVRTEADVKPRRRRLRKSTSGNEKPAGKKGWDALPTWAKALICLSIGTVVTLVRADCDSGGGGSASSSGTWQSGGGDHYGGPTRAPAPRRVYIPPSGHYGERTRAPGTYSLPWRGMSAPQRDEPTRPRTAPTSQGIRISPSRQAKSETCSFCRGTGNGTFHCISCGGRGIDQFGVRCTGCYGRKFQSCSNCFGKGTVTSW